MRLLITGWQGQLAQALVAAAFKRPDIEACAVGRPALDLCQQPTIERALADVRPHLVVNTAAYTAVDAAEKDRAAAFALNADGAGLIASDAARRGVPILHISTDYVFDGHKAEPYVESDATAPQCVYGASKLAGELAVAAANPRHVVLRTAWVYSEYGKNFMKTMLRLAADRAEISVVDDQVGSPTYAPHLADAVLTIAGAIARGAVAEGAWGIYHAAGSGSTSWCGFARRIMAEAPAHGHKAAAIRAIASADYPTPAQRPANSRLDCAKLKAALSVELPHWHIGVSQCLARLAAVARTPEHV
jgi:dTDP-4-dehydrorhamnose reductase